MSPEVWRRFTASSLFWPVAALVALLVFDAVAVPGFFALRIQDGHLYGSLVDILKNGSPTAIIALGMTLVIATRGIDLSVGATVAISAELEEVLRLSDRVAVLRDRHKVAELPRAEASMGQVMELIARGGSDVA